RCTGVRLTLGVGRYGPGGAMAPSGGRRQGVDGPARRKRARRVVGRQTRGGRRPALAVLSGSGPRLRDGHRPGRDGLSSGTGGRGAGLPWAGGVATRRASPIQRLPAMWGLVGLVPIAVLLFKQDITRFEAGMRALVVLAAVVFLRGLGDKAVRGLVATLEPEPVDIDETPQKPEDEAA